jgi:hypothetical protein
MHAARLRLEELTDTLRSASDNRNLPRELGHLAPCSE